MKKNVKVIVFIVFASIFMYFIISYLDNRKGNTNFSEYFTDGRYDNDSLGTFYSSSQKNKYLSEDSIMFKALLFWKKGKLMADGYIVKDTNEKWVFLNKNYSYKFYDRGVNIDSLKSRYIDGSATDY